MTLKTAMMIVQKFVTDNSPGILTGLGVAGTLTAIGLTGRSAFRVGMDVSTQYHEALREGEPLPEHLLERKHLVKTYWKEFIPSAIIGTSTVTCIILSNRIGARRTAAIAAAFKISEELAEEYREKVKETFGLQKEEKMRAELATDRMERTMGHETIVIAGSEVLFFDSMSGRYFKNEMENVRSIVNDINYQVNNDYFASLTDFYEKLGLEKTGVSDEFGWNSDQLLEVTYTTCLVDNKPAIEINYNKVPIRDYDRVL